MRTDRLPVAPFRELLLRRYERDGDLDKIAAQIGLDPRSVYRLLNSNKYINFESADAIVTYLYGPMYWHENPVLSEIYGAVNLRRLDWASPTSQQVEDEQLELLREAFNRLGAVYRASAEVGADPQVAANILQKAGVDITPRRTYFCPRGHDARVTGRYSDGSCKACSLERNRAWRKSKNPNRKTRKHRSALEAE